MNRVLNVGLIGYGMAGQAFHAPIINAVPNLRLTKVVERHSHKAMERYPWVTVVDNVEVLWQDQELELVVIAVPNALHYELAKQALLHGKHVVVEKPFTVTAQQAQELIDIAESQKLILSVFQNRRWDGDFRTIQQIVRENLLGRIVEYEAHYDRYLNYIRPNTWKEESGLGSGILYDLGSHLIDQAQVLFGTPRSVTAKLCRQREESKIDDSFELRLDYSELTVTLKAGMLVRERGPHFVIHGNKGSFVKYGLDGQEEMLKKGLAPSGVSDPSWGLEPQEQWGMLNTDFGGLHCLGKIETLPGAYPDFYANIYAAIVKSADLCVKPEQARNTIRIIELAAQSNAENRTVKFEL
ncbi:MAG: oxidoreductase [Peptococcaceae bacterium]|nr:oxidoreductase [Peptococcaceae bacterium]